MAVISEKYKFIYSLAPRTASTATANYLKTDFNAKEVLLTNILSDDGDILIDKKHISFIEIKNNKLIEEAIFNSYTKIVTVRNPFDSLYSAWFKMRNTYIPLLKDKDSWIYKKPDFIKNMEFIRDHSFSDWICEFYAPMTKKKSKHLYASHLHFSNRVIKFENLENDLQNIFDELGIKQKVNIPLLNKTKGKDISYVQAYNDQAMKVVETIYKPDLDKFSYSFGS